MYNPPKCFDLKAICDDAELFVLDAITSNKNPELFVLRAISNDNPELNVTESFWKDAYQDDRDRYFDAVIFVERKIAEGFDTVEYQAVEIFTSYPACKGKILWIM